MSLTERFDFNDWHSDVNVNEKRFSFDFDHGQLLTGDQIEITSTDDSALDFIDSYTDTSVKKFIYVDELDGIRLYDSFAACSEWWQGERHNSCNTRKFTCPIEVSVEAQAPRLLAQVQQL